MGPNQSPYEWNWTEFTTGLYMRCHSVHMEKHIEEYMEVIVPLLFQVPLLFRPVG